MRCEEIGFGTYDCAYNVMLPYRVTDPSEPEKPPFGKYIAVDKCLLGEVVNLWERGIKTTGCCCGHGKEPPFIGVADEFISRMKELGYKVRYNVCRPEAQDSFIPKTSFTYGDINKGFNWWD